MPSPTFTALRAAILAKLNTLKYDAGTNPSGVLMQVKSDHDENFTGFPVATFEPSGHESAFFLNTDNQRGYGFDIIIWQEIEAGGRNNAITVLAAAVDAVVTAFESDYNLSGACDFCTPLPSAWGDVVIGSATFKYAKMTLVCKSEVEVVTQ